MRSRRSVDVAASCPCGPTLPTLNDGFSAPQQLDALGVVDRVAQPVGVLRELAEPTGQPVVVGSAHWSPSAHSRVELGEPPVDLDVAGARAARPTRSSRSQLSSSTSATAAEVLEPHARREHQNDRRLELGIVEQLVDEPPPALVERDARRDLVADLDPRRQPGLDRELGEDALRERVQRADRGRVELVERTRARSSSPRMRCSQLGSRTRSRSSAAAFSVNVIAAIARIGTIGRGRTSATIRSTSTAVLPVPAPASTNSVSSSSLRIASAPRSSPADGIEEGGLQIGHSIAPVSAT